MDQRPRISVLLPVKHAAGSLAAAIRSVLFQTLADWELLLLLDGPDQKTRDIAVGFASDPRIRVLGSGEGRGISFRLNQGVQAAHGEYVARMDADDLCYPGRFALQASFLDANPHVDLLGGSTLLFNAAGDALACCGSRGPTRSCAPISI